MTAADLRERAAQLAAGLARQLTASGVLHSVAWDMAVRTVPRHVFVPSYVEQQPDRTWRTVSADQPETYEEWLAAVYSDRPLTTALLKDETGQLTPISSSSKPGLMLRMLEALDLDRGHRVLEIGTGTGYNAGLLCSRLGAENVVSVDVESPFVEAARLRLAQLGFAPTLAATDGADGLPAAGLVDRIIATCSVPRIPGAWVEQVVSGGRVLTDLKITGAAGNLVDLRATSGGLQGRFLPQWAGFMPLRPKVKPGPAAGRLPEVIERDTVTPSASPWWDNQVVWFLAALRLPPGVMTGVRLDEVSMRPVANTMRSADGSWAEVTQDQDGKGRRIVRGSAADLWAEVERAYELWHELNEPDWDSFGVTVTEGEQRAWFGTPAGDYTWPLPNPCD